MKNPHQNKSASNKIWPVFFYTDYISKFFPPAFHLTKKNIVSIVRLNLLFIAILILNTYISALLSIRISFIREQQNFFLYIFAIPVFSYFISGFIYFYSELLKQRTVSVYYLFKGYRWFFPVFLYNTVIYILFILFAFISLSFFQREIIIKIRIIFGLFFFIWFFVRSIFSIPLIIEYSVGTREAIHISFQITRNRFWEVISYLFLTFLIAILGLIFLGFGFLGSLGFFSGSTLLLFFSLIKNKPALYKAEKFDLQSKAKRKT